MKKLFCVMGCLVLLNNSPAWAQGDKPSVIVVRTSESNLKLFITTARGEDKPVMEEFKFTYKEYSEQVTAKYQQLIASYLEQGFVLQSMASAPYPGHTFIFIKAPRP
ncbi:hypothetical protein DNI29_16895 [Hymenobacter sediminis]|uniref:hypothetical protein n=1 Tax=Hymenobacter sediminis TaxID=2218621 RepID=UPI000DA6C5D5|nr:hypothetical protein [Hymenobacter sediminis]RPD45827.1 hypothetical protein DNI29_16895 [Hymenobacter sediminis]